MSRYAWVLFDADLTLFDFDKASAEALGEVLAEHGVDWQAEMYSDYKRINVQCWTEHEQGLIPRDVLVYERFKRYFDFRKVDLDPIATQQQYLHRLGAKPYLMPGAENLLNGLQGKVRLGYVTNGMREVQRPRLQMIGWEEKFEMIVVGGELGLSKPHREYFDHVHDLIGRPDHESVLVVGDSVSADMEGALNHGYHACWYNPQLQPYPQEPLPQYIISHLDELEDILFRSQVLS